MPTEYPNNVRFNARAYEGDARKKVAYTPRRKLISPNKAIIVLNNFNDVRYFTIEFWFFVNCIISPRCPYFCIIGGFLGGKGYVKPGFG